MTTPFVTLRRHPYEEPYHLQVELVASNGTFGGGTDFYTSPDDLRALGTALRGFPTRAPDELVYEYGSDDPADRSYRHVRLRAYTVDRAGHCALQLSVDRTTAEPHEGVCRFSIPAEAAALNRLGDLLVRFAELRHVELRWTPAREGGALFEDPQP